MNERYLKENEDLSKLSEMVMVSDAVIAQMESMGYTPVYTSNKTEFVNKRTKLFIEYKPEFNSYFSGARPNGHDEDVKNAIYHEVVSHLIGLGKKNKSGLVNRLTN